jgi:cyclase
MSSNRRDHANLPPSRVQEVSDGVYAYIQPDGSWWINNTGFMVGRRGVVSIDACSTQRRTEAYQEAIRGVTDQPVRTLINTHHHGDHTFGNYLFGSATIIGHERCREEVLRAGLPYDAPVWTEVNWGPVELAPPFVTYEDGVTLHVDDLVCEVRYVGGPAHTTNDSIVWVPERRLLFSGDLIFNGGTPFLLMGSISGAIRVLEERVKVLPIETIVPGHGPVCGPELVDDVLGYLRFVQQVAEQGKAAGLSPLEAAYETDLNQYSALLDSERLVGNLHRAYTELEGHEPGARIDTAAALSDMVAYNGGKPLSCDA